MKQASLQRRIFTFYSILMVTISAIIVGITQNLYTNIVIEKIGQSRVDVLKQITERTTTVKNTMLHVSNTFYTNGEILSYILQDDLTEEMKNEFLVVAERNVQATDAVFQSKEFEFDIAVYAKNGLSYSTRSTEEEYDFGDLKNELWYKDIVSKLNEANWISSSSAAVNNNNSTVSVVRMVQNEQQEVQGAIIISINEAILKASYENMIAEDSDIFIVDEAGKVVSNKNENMLGLKYFSMNRLNDIVEEKNFQVITNSKGDRLLAAYKGTNLGWTIVELINTEHIFGDVREATYVIFVLVIVAIGLAVSLAYYFAKKTVAPLRLFEKDIERVQNGDMTVISNVGGWQEMREIGNAFNKMIVKIQELMNGIKKEESEKHELELAFLQEQINPHFMYNTLFSIKCLVSMEKNKEAEVMLENFINLLRMVLSKEGDFIVLWKELECTEKYVNLQKYRYGDKIEIYMECGEDCMEAMIPKLILQPIVENAIFHGIEPKKGKGVIVISVCRMEENLQISVSDDGVGMTPEKIEAIYKGDKQRTHKEFNMIGVYNIQQRIKLYYGKEYGVQITSEEDCGTVVTLTMPFTKGDMENDNKK